MVNYVIRRLLLIFPTLLGITILVFAVMAAAPGGVGASLLSRSGDLRPEERAAMAVKTLTFQNWSTSTTFWDVTSLHLSGAVGQHENTASGLAFNASADPRTANWRSRIMVNASMVNAPVITGFSPNSKLSNSR